MMHRRCAVNDSLPSKVDNTFNSTIQEEETVSVVIPCYNEERFILKNLYQLLNQYDRNRYEIIIVDGFSTDRTRTLVEQFQRDNPSVPVRLIDNPEKNIPTALNRGIA